MKFIIPQNSFEKAFRLGDGVQYEMFIEKVNKELAEKLHPSAVLDELDFISTWKDAGGNTHATLIGKVSGLGTQKELGGVFVWLKNLNRFRGTVWSSLEPHSDLQLLMKARESYRQTAYHEAKIYLDAIQRVDNLPRSAIKLRTLVEKRIKNELYF